MNNQTISFLVIGLLAGIVLTGTVASYAVNHSNSGMMEAFGMHDQNHLDTVANDNMPGMNMSSSKASLSSPSNSVADMASGLTGDSFDKMFISEMIIHHQGAISMAKLAASQAKHQEVKDLASNIVAAQSSEIAQMQAWQKQWGY